MALELSHVPQLIVGVYVFYLGLFVFFKKPGSMVHLSFLLTTLTTAFWLVPYIFSYRAPDPIAYNIFRFSYSSIIFIPAALYHFCMSVLNEKRERKYVIISYIGMIPFLILIWTSPFIIERELYHYSWGNYPKVGAWHPFFLALFIFTQTRVNFLVITRYLKAIRSKDTESRDKAFFLTLGAFVFNLASVDFLPNYGIDIHPNGFLFAGIFASCITAAILTKRILDFNIVKRTLIYSITVFLLSCTYVIFIFFLAGSAIKSNYWGQSLATNLAVISLLVLFFKPIEIFLTRYLDKRFFHGSIFEISEQKEKLETELERRERLKSVGILAAGMAHEIKNPITSLQTFVEYLPQKKEDPEYIEKFQKIAGQEISRIKNIVSDLLAFSKPQEPKRQRTDVRNILSGILDLLSGEFLRYKIKLNHNFHESAPEVHVDAEQIKQAFLNIILNAIDAMKEKGGDLTVSLNPKHDGLEISIRDTGCGIEPEKLPHIFDPFYSNKESGTGLGLAITHSIVQKNGGSIEIQSEVGKGTVFTIKLPSHD